MRVAVAAGVLLAAAGAVALAPGIREAKREEAAGSVPGEGSFRARRPVTVPPACGG